MTVIETASETVSGSASGTVSENTSGNASEGVSGKETVIAIMIPTEIVMTGEAVIGLIRVIMAGTVTMMIVVIMIVVETTPGIENILLDMRMMIADAVLDEFLI